MDESFPIQEELSPLEKFQKDIELLKENKFHSDLEMVNPGSLIEEDMNMYYKIGQVKENLLGDLGQNINLKDNEDFKQEINRRLGEYEFFWQNNFGPYQREIMMMSDQESSRVGFLSFLAHLSAEIVAGLIKAKKAVNL